MTDTDSNCVSDNIVTLRAVRLGFDSLQEKRFSSSPPVRTSAGPHVANSRNGFRGLSYGVKRMGCVGNHSPQFSAGRVRRWEDNIKMDLQEVGGACEDWMELAQDRDGWRALVSTVMNLRVPKMRGIS